MSHKNYRLTFLCNFKLVIYTKRMIIMLYPENKQKAKARMTAARHPLAGGGGGAYAGGRLSPHGNRLS